MENKNNQEKQKSNAWKTLPIVGIFLGITSFTLFFLAMTWSKFYFAYDIWFWIELLCLAFVLPGFFILRKEQGANRNLAIVGIIIGGLVGILEFCYWSVLIAL